MNHPLGPDSRRQFVKKSLAASIVAAQPTILAGLLRADGGGGGGTTTGWQTTAPPTTNPWETGTTLETTIPPTTVWETGTTDVTTVPQDRYRWILRCKGDPLSGVQNEEQLRADQELQPRVILVNGLGGRAFHSMKNTTFDPPGPGDQSNCQLRAHIIAQGPIVNSQGGSMSIATKLDGGLIVRDMRRVYFGPPVPENQRNEGCHFVDEILVRTITVSIASHTGAVSIVPGSPVSSGDSTLGSLGYTQASYQAFAAFKVEASVNHSFRNAYSGEVSAEVEAEFKKIFGVAFSASLAVDLNRLGGISSDPDPLMWSIVKVEQILDENGQVVSEKEFPLGVPLTQ